MSHDATRWVRDHADVKAGAEWAVLMVLATYVRNGGNTAWPSVSTIAKNSRYTPGNVNKTLKTLRDKGLIKAVGYRGQVKEYQLAIDQPLPNGIVVSDVQPLPNGIGDHYPIGAEPLSNRVDKLGRTGIEPGGGGGRHSAKLAAVVPAVDTPPKNHLNIPEGWLEMNDGIQRCLERHPDGNHRNEPCRSCRDTQTQIGRLRGERAREDAAREREQSSNRRRGKDSCDICDDRGERPGINSRTNQVDYPKCDHTENDRRDAIEALMKEGKVSAVQRMESGRTRLKAV